MNQKTGQTGHDLPVGFYRQSGRDMIYFSFREKGVRFTMPTGIKECPVRQSTLRALEEFKRKEVARVQNKDLAKVIQGVRVDQLLNDYVAHLRKKERDKGDYTTKERTWADRVESINKNNLIRFFGHLKPDQVKGKLNAYRDKLETEGWSPATINGHFRVLSAAMIRGWKNDKVAHADLPKEYPFNHEGERGVARTGTIDDATIAKLSKELAPHIRIAFLTCIHTGLRPKELRWLKKEQVILEGDAPRIVVIHHKIVGKTRMAKVPAIVDELLPVLKEWAAMSEKQYPTCEWFFHYEGKRLGSYRTAWYAALKRAKIPVGSVLFYDARRTAATELSKAGVSNDDRKAQLGHITDPMADQYNQDHITHVKRILDKTGKAKPQPVVVKDWKSELRELKETFEAGLLPEDLYRAEVAETLKRRNG